MERHGFVPLCWAGMCGLGVGFVPRSGRRALSEIGFVPGEGATGSIGFVPRVQGRERVGMISFLCLGPLEGGSRSYPTIRTLLNGRQIVCDDSDHAKWCVGYRVVGLKGRCIGQGITLPPASI